MQATPHRTAPHRTAPHRTAPHRTCLRRFALVVFWASSVGMAWAATDYVFSANQKDRYGRRLKLDEDGVTGAPCIPYESGAVEDIDWGYGTVPYSGSWGMARDRDYPTSRHIWASAYSDNIVNDLWGGVSYQPASETLTYQFDNTQSSAQVVDIAAKVDSPGFTVIPEKVDGDWNKTRISSPTSTYQRNANEPAQIEWAGTSNVLVATEMGTNSCGTADGAVKLLFANGLNIFNSFQLLEYYIPGAVFKPEGLTVFDVSSSEDDECDGYDYVAYVVEHCDSSLVVFGIVEDGASSDIDYLDEVAIPDSPDSHDCEPSTVEFLKGRDQAVILCQSSQSYIVFDTSGIECSPDDLDFSDHFAFKYTTETTGESGATGSCADAHVLEDEDCWGEEENVGCSPHDVAYDEDFFEDWAFVTLTRVGEISAIELESPWRQTILYSDYDDNDMYQPLELELGEDPS